jgi:transcriptional regulator
MFVPALYRCADAALERAVIDENPLALLATNGPTRPFVTHIPAIVDPNLRTADLTGGRLLCHLNRANPHWRSLRDGQSAVLTFDGPGDYVSPVCYPAGPTAPTWDFVSVEVTGRISVLTDPDAVLAVVRSTAEALEGRFGGGWHTDGSQDHFRRILPGVGAFELVVDGVSSMFKLSQEKHQEIQENVIRRFERGDRGRSRDLAGAMRAYHQRSTCPVPSLIDSVEETSP